MNNIKRNLIAAAGRFVVSAVTFDGTNDYMTRGAALTGVADGKLGILSFWIKFNSEATQRIIEIPGIRFKFDKYLNDVEELYARDTVPAQCLGNNFTRTQVADGWTHYLSSWTLATTTAHHYQDDISDKAAEVKVNAAIDYSGSAAEVYFGCTAGLASKLNADIAEFYLNTVEYLDFSVEANRRKFITSDGKPADLGPTGLLPTTNQPMIYFSARPGDAATAFATNRGTGGNFSITGTLALTATSPSD